MSGAYSLMRVAVMQGRAATRILVGLLALAGMSFCAARVLVPRSPTQLEVVGPSRRLVEHPDRNAPLDVTFRLRNPTARPIRILRIKTGCTCASGKPAFQVV